MSSSPATADTPNMSYTDSAALAANEAFRQRVRGAVINAAIQIMNEARTVYDVNYYDRREALAREVINGSINLDKFVWAVAINPAVVNAGEAAPDGDIDFVISSVWDAMAGISAGEKPSSA